MKKTIAFICACSGSMLLGMLSAVVANLSDGATLTKFGSMALIPLTCFGTGLVGMAWIYFFYILPREKQNAK